MIFSKSLPTVTFPPCLAGDDSSVTESSVTSNEASFEESIPVEHVQRTQQRLRKIEEDFNVFCGCIDCYFHAFVPTKVKIPHGTPPSLFDQPRCWEDYDVFCSSIAAGLNRLIQLSPKRRHLAFLRTQGRRLKPPVSIDNTDGWASSPTIVASLPGKDRAFYALPEWANVSIAFEVMQHNVDDPIGKESEKNENTLTRIAHHAQNIFVAQNRLFVFVVGIFGSSARIFRFDHAAAVVSEAFDYTERPDILREFLWRFVHPLSTTSSVAGADPSIQIPEEVDIYRAQRLLDESGKPPLSQAEQKMCRWITVRDRNGGLLRFFAFRLLYTNPSMFSRASSVWEAFKDGEKTKRTYVIKDAWRRLCFPAETDFYDVLHEGVNSVRHGSRSADAYDHVDIDPCLLGLAQDYIGVDLGRREYLRYNAGCDSMRCAQLAKNPNTSRTSCTDACVPHRSLLSGHCTISSARLGMPLDSELGRSHMRLVLKTVGRPISRFTRTYQLIEAFRDAIIEHTRLVSSRDISEGNVLLAEDESFTGFIGDFDHSFNWKMFLKERGLEVSRESWEQYARQRYVANNGPGTRRDEPGDHPLGERRPIKRWAQERTGTLYFIAVEVMEGISLHEARHDLESFYWLLFWLMLRHTKHDHHYRQKTSDLYFKAPSDSALAEYKSVWLIQNMPILVPGNRPLSKLLVDLGDLCRRNCLLVKDPIEPLTHEAMLARFNEALASPDWPEEDPAIPLKPEPQPSDSSKSDLSDTNESHSIRRTASTQAPHSTHWFEDRLIRSADYPVRYKHTRDLQNLGQKVAFQSRLSKRSREDDDDDDDDDDDYKPVKRPRLETHAPHHPSSDLRAAEWWNLAGRLSDNCLKILSASTVLMSATCLDSRSSDK
ncbi:hypothetical protein POSPLADRAFT_1049485 [Postia placenta MAD-698-R-SB12]|uniref:Fungal-type protein kinase domain-containing protein n=1 Tax=Postia placenta MAD-698-R-SB12 TaxID=670580 RepID=A0A1X6MPC2_9APHY|nr:hypothetical protein POSPLADRAFT_1049485 [Postia placenta MAD-698-R-SB12]OSX58251.1 hypothetical protein POSPLADRAFT_1049485 [Postia placenta MAD-698-R-SB12]